MSKLALKIINVIITFFLAFFYQIPLGSEGYLVIDFKIFTFDEVSYYFWGYIFEESVYIALYLKSIENIIPLILWLILIMSAVLPFFATNNEQDVVRSLKIYEVNILLIILLLVVWGLIIFTYNLENVVQIFFATGLGYYLLCVLLISNIVLLILTIQKNKKVI